jgi:hypothetical protein
VGSVHGRDRVRRVWGDARAGRYEVAYQVGHPLGFYSHTYVGELALGRVLADPTGEVAELQARTRQYPAALGEALVAGLWEADFALRIARYGAAGADATYAAGCLFRVVGVACHALHGRAGRWLINEKGMVTSAAGLPARHRASLPPPMRCLVPLASPATRSSRQLVGPTP